MSALDWDRPIRFQNGQPCRLIKEWSVPGRRYIERIGASVQTSIWEVNEAGETGPLAHRCGFVLENVPEDLA